MCASESIKGKKGVNISMLFVNFEGFEQRTTKMMKEVESQFLDFKFLSPFDRNQHRNTLRKGNISQQSTYQKSMKTSDCCALQNLQIMSINE